MFSCTTAQHIYCTNTVQTVQPATEQYLQQFNRSCCHMFSCTTAQHIYCTNTVQTVQSATEQYLQQFNRSCCYMFSCTTAQHIYGTCTVKLYSLQLNCTYSNLTEAAATFLAAQKQSIFAVEILFKLYIL